MIEHCESCGEKFTEDNPLYNKDDLTCLDCFTSEVDALWDAYKESGVEK